MSAEINPENEKPRTINERSFYRRFLFFAGILLPAVTFFVELITRMCAGILFDPMPTWWHALFVFFVPVTNLQIWLALRKGQTERLSWLSFANSLVIFISLFYALIFAPFTPFAVIGILYIGLGLLPLAPLFSLIASILLRRELRKIASHPKPFALRWQGLAVGLLMVCAAIILAELPFTLTKIGVRKVNSASIEEQNEGLKFLRRFGDRDYLLRLCYSNSGRVMSDFAMRFLESGNIVDTQASEPLSKQSQEAFYRLTGKNYRQVPTPRGIRNWDSFDRWDTVDETDATRINQGLLLVGSQMDGSADGDAALGYLEWTLVFKNNRTWQQEAVSQIQLPPGATVSRLTLWINGEEREAAFAKSAKATEAYNAVTARRLDPALVTTVGKDRISLKCSPVPAGGEMKVRIGMTVPLVLENEASSLLPLPFFQDRNFAVPTAHAVWIESKKPLEIANPTFVHEQRNELFAVRGSVKNEELVKIGSPIRAGKSAAVKIAWAKDKNNPQIIVKQEIKESIKPKIERIVFVVDTSATMSEFQSATAEAIKNLLPETETALVLTGGNGLNLETSAPKSFIGNPSQTAETISNATFGGGTDSVPAIVTAWELAQAKPNSAIVWIHAPQPLEITQPQNLTQLWTRRPNSAPIYSLQITNGKDVVDRVLSESNLVNTVPRFGGLQEDLSRLLSELNKQKQIYEAVRTTENASNFANSPNAKETSQHLIRLWANDEIKRLLTANENEKATDLAIKNQLVTPVSGAVVLETQQQYDQFGLRPVESNTVPTVPEPEEYLLFGVVLAILIWLAWRARKQKLQTV